MDIKKISELSINERQCIAIVSFERFCRNYNITHASIDAFTEHVWKIAQLKDNFYEWSNKFTELDITGQGDPYPEDLIKVIPEKLLDDFDKITQYVYETSATCWYSGENNNSTIMLMKIFELLSKYQISIPNIDCYQSNLKKDKDGWISAISDETLKKWKTIL